MNQSLLRLSVVALVLALGASVQAQVINGLKSVPRVFNDFPGSTLNITNSNSIPGNVTINDSQATPGPGANRHDVLLSTDAGATAYTFSIDTPFTISTNLVLTDGSNSPRKEAGIRINAPVTGDVLFLVNSDAGEIVTFGDGSPFHLFGSNGGGNGYVPGTSITMGMKYTPGSPSTTGSTPSTVEYFVNYPALGGFVTTGALPWGNLEGGPTNFTVGVYGQWAPASTGDFINAQFTNINAFVPEPASAAVLALGGLGLLSRRRRA